MLGRPATAQEKAGRGRAEAYLCSLPPPGQACGMTGARTPHDR